MMKENYRGFLNNFLLLNLILIILSPSNLLSQQERAWGMVDIVISGGTAPKYEGDFKGFFARIGNKIENKAGDCFNTENDKIFTLSIVLSVEKDGSLILDRFEGDGIDTSQYCFDIIQSILDEEEVEYATFKNEPVRVIHDFGINFTPSGKYTTEKVRREIDLDKVYLYSETPPETENLEAEILADMATSPTIENGRYSATIIINRDASIEVESVSTIGVKNSKSNEEVTRIIESKKADKSGHEYGTAIRVKSSLVLWLTSDVREEVARKNVVWSSKLFSNPIFLAKLEYDQNTSRFYDKNILTISKDKEKLYHFRVEKEWSRNRKYVISVDTTEAFYDIVKIEKNSCGNNEVYVNLRLIQFKEWLMSSPNSDLPPKLNETKHEYEYQESWSSSKKKLTINPDFKSCGTTYTRHNIDFGGELGHVTFQILINRL